MRAITGILLLCAWSALCYTPEEFAAGKKLLNDFSARNRRMVLDRTHALVRSQTKYSGRLYLRSFYLFDDRPLFGSRELWSPGGSDHKPESFDRSMELYKLSGLDGYATFAWPGKGEFRRTMLPVYESAGRNGFRVMLEVAPDYIRKLQPETLMLIAGRPESFRIGKKSLISSYIMDSVPPEKIREQLERLRKIAGDRIAFIPQIHFLNFSSGGKKINGHDLYSIYRQHGTLPEPLVRDLAAYLRSYLAVCDGVYLGHFSSRPDGSLDEQFDDDVLYPLFHGVLSEPEFNGKKLFAVMGKCGYTAYYGAQNLSRDGTQTLRTGLENALKWKPDLYIGTEWDELNEDTGFQPLVAKPMSTLRILRYYTSRFKNAAPTPLPGDDLSVPNLIVSFRQQLIPGERMKVELLNVPDSPEKEKYSVVLELLSLDGKVLFRSPAVAFDTGLPGVRVFEPPTEQWSAEPVLRPRLTVGIRGKEQIFGTGLPFTIVRSSTDNLQYFCFPLRNVLRPEKAVFSVRNGNVKCQFRSPETLAAAEVMQNSRERFVFTPGETFGAFTPGRKLFLLEFSYFDHGKRRIVIDGAATVENAPSLKVILPDEDSRKPDSVAENFPPLRDNADWWIKRRFFSVAEQDIPRAVLKISGIRKSGPEKGRAFEWRVPLAQTLAGKIVGKSFPDGLTFALEVEPSPKSFGLPLNRKEVVFDKAIVFDQPDAVVSFRAVSKAGKVFWSDPELLGSAEKETRPVKVYSDFARKAVEVSMPVNRAKTIRYDFKPENGSILTTSAGREFYAMIGGYQAHATGFQGLEGAYAPFRHGRTIPGGTPVPQWVEVDGVPALKFSGSGNFVMFPSTLLPQRGAFTIEFSIKPETLDQKTVLLCNQGVLVGGLDVEARKGKLSLSYVHRNLHDDKLPWYRQDRFQSDVPLISGRWQTVKITYDGERISVSANGKKQSFPLRGTGIYLQSTHFGGRGAAGSFFNGYLRDFCVKHYVEKENE